MAASIQPAIVGRNKGRPPDLINFIINAKVKIMTFNIYLNDLNEATIEKIREHMKRNLQSEIEEAVNFGVDRSSAETEIVNEYLNCHNFGVPLEI